MRFFPTSIYYTVRDGKLVTWLCGIDEKRKTREIPLLDTHPSFWVDEHPKPHPLMVDYQLNCAQDMWGKPLHRIDAAFPYDIPRIRESYVNTYEADIYYDRRVRYDHGIHNCIDIPDELVALRPGDITPLDPSINIEPRVWTLDIETHYEGGKTTPKYPTDEVISIAIHDSLADKYIVILNGDLSDEDRAEFLRRCKERKPELTEDYQDVEWDVRISTVNSEMNLFLELHRIMDVLKPNIIRGWNFCSTGKYHEGFDWPYLTHRAENHGYPFPDSRRFQIWDSMQAYNRMHSRARGQPKDGLSLNAVAVNEGIGHKMQHDGIVKMYNEDRASLLYYNVMDVFLNKTIDADCLGGTLEFYLNLARSAGCALEDTVSEMRMIDSFVSQWLAKNKPHIKQPTSASETDRDIVGGLVRENKAGVYGPTAQLDLSQAYTGAIRSFNLSPETKVRGTPDPERPVCTTPTGRHYYTDVKGIFPEILDGLAERMDYLKAQGRHDERQIMKSINHSFYGNMKNKYYRNRDVDIAEDILQIARHQAVFNADFAERQDLDVLYGDTDSIYIHADCTTDELEAIGEELAASINSAYDEWSHSFGLDQHYFKIDFEDAYVAQIFARPASKDGEGAKKRYACLTRDGELIIKGFGSRRRDLSRFARGVQREVLRRILSTKDPAKVREFVQETRIKMITGEIPFEELAKPMGLGNPLSNYIEDGEPIKGCPQQYKAAIWSNKHLGTEFDRGDVIYLVPGYVDGFPRTAVFALGWGMDMPQGARVNIDKLIDNNLRKPLETIVDALGMSWQDTVSGTVGTTLEDF